jgi:tetratricopeptide (TPR) repeat protein
MEGAAVGRVQRVGHLALHRRARFASVVHLRNRIEQHARVGVARAAEQIGLVGQLDQAADLTAEIIHSHPTYLAAYDLAAKVDQERGRLAEAQAHLQAAVGHAPHGLLRQRTLGRLAAEKNLDVLLRAFESLKATDPSARLVLVGDGPERAALQQRCPEAHFAGLRRGEDLAAHYASADLFLFPSLTETFGNVTPEAMASGLPVVSTTATAIPEVVPHGRAGLLVPPRDPQALAEWAQAAGLQEIASVYLAQRNGFQVQVRLFGPA